MGVWADDDSFLAELDVERCGECHPTPEVAATRKADTVRRSQELLHYFGQFDKAADDANEGDETTQAVRLQTVDTHAFHGGQGILATADAMLSRLNEAEQRRDTIQTAISAGDPAALAIASSTNSSFAELKALLETWQPFDIPTEI